MIYNQKNIIELNNYIDSYIETMKNKYEKINAIQDKIDHINRTVILTEKIAPKNDLAKIATKYHDIGRFMQYELIGKFDDALVSHHTLGENTIINAILKGEIQKSPELDIIRLAIMYHGRMQYIPYLAELNNDAKEIIDIVTRADEIENGCIGALGYLERESKEDAKNYRKNNLNLDMKKVSSNVLNFYLEDKKFDKIKYCKTYADYVLFANILVTSSLKGKDKNIAIEALNLKCFKYKNAIEGYKDLFRKMIEPDLVDKCIETFERRVYQMETQKEMWEKVVNKLINNKLTISTMESCTGGGIANKITNISGASAVLNESYVTYSNKAKIKQGVSKKIIEKYTVYSSQTALEMARAVKEQAQSDIGIGVTGQLGRIDPNNPVDKLNCVWFAIINNKNEKTVEEVHVADGTRDEQKEIVIKKIAQKLLEII